MSDGANQVRADAGNDLVTAEANDGTIQLSFTGSRLIYASNNNRIEAGAGDGTVELLAGSSGSQVARGEGRDRLRAIDARDHTWVSSSGHVKDTSYFAETTSSCVALALVLKSCRSHDIPSQAGG